MVWGDVWRIYVSAYLISEHRGNAKPVIIIDHVDGYLSMLNV